jgi:hypothetical protein
VGAYAVDDGVAGLERVGGLEEGGHGDGAGEGVEAA